MKVHRFSSYPVVSAFPGPTRQRAHPGVLTILLLSTFIIVGCGGSGGGNDSNNDDSASDDSPSTAVRTDPLPPGDSDCPNGGILVETGIDDNGNGVLEDSEVDTSEKVCNGNDGSNGQDGNDGQDGDDGQDGSDGFNALVNQTVEPGGANCPSGGVRYDVGIDLNRNGVLENNEITDTLYICNPSSLSDGNAYGWEQLDSWGDGWDGAERAQTTWEAANTRCESLGGRLPTLTELYRVSTAQASDVGNAYTSGFLWSRTWWDADNTRKGVLRLTDGVATHINITASSGYRCIWPSDVAGHFENKQCFGPPGGECWQTVGDRGLMNMDVYERPRVSYIAANDECNFVNAHLAHLQDYAENVRAGLPNGSNEYAWAADAGRYDTNFVVRWQGADPAFADWASPYVSWSARASGLHKFRCKGVASNLGAYPETVANQFVVPTTQIKASASSNNPVIFSSALDQCTSLGGHMAHPRDIMELARGGMPNGPGTGSSDYIWLADRSRYDSTQITRWGGTDTSFSDYYAEYSTSSIVNSTTLRDYRCVFYPLDPNYSSPDTAACAGNAPCYAVDFGPGATPPKYAVDATDRPVATYSDAIDDCVAMGGRLPSTRQLTELIRSGLDNGTLDWLWTSDASSNSGFAYSTILRWNGIDTNFEPVYPANATWDAKGTRTYNYRCVWTNELW